MPSIELLRRGPTSAVLDEDGGISLHVMENSFDAVVREVLEGGEFQVGVREGARTTNEESPAIKRGTGGDPWEEGERREGTEATTRDVWASGENGSSAMRRKGTEADARNDMRANGEGGSSAIRRRVIGSTTPGSKMNEEEKWERNGEESGKRTTTPSLVRRRMTGEDDSNEAWNDNTPASIKRRTSLDDGGRRITTTPSSMRRMMSEEERGKTFEGGDEGRGRRQDEQRTMTPLEVSMRKNLERKQQASQAADRNTLMRDEVDAGGAPWKQALDRHAQMEESRMHYIDDVPGYSQDILLPPTSFDSKDLSPYRNSSKAAFLEPVPDLKAMKSRIEPLIHDFDYNERYTHAPPPPEDDFLEQEPVMSAKDWFSAGKQSTSNTKPELDYQPSPLKRPFDTSIGVGGARFNSELLNSMYEARSRELAVVSSEVYDDVDEFDFDDNAPLEEKENHFEENIDGGANDYYYDHPPPPPISSPPRYEIVLADYSFENKKKSRRDPLAIDLDRFRYVPMHRDLRFPIVLAAPAQRREAVSTLDSAVGELISDIPGVSSASDLFFSGRAGGGVHDSNEYVLSLGKNMMEKPLTTLLMIKAVHDKKREVSGKGNSPGGAVSSSQASAFLDPEDAAKVDQELQQKRVMQDEIDRLQKRVQELSTSMLQVYQPMFAANHDGSIGSPPRKAATAPGGEEAALKKQNQALKMLLRGAMFVKTTPRGTTHRRFVWCSPNLRTVYWSPDSSGVVTTETKSMPLKGAGVIVGQKTSGFDARNQPGVGLRCFSIVNESKTLDLEILRAESSAFDDEQHRNEWVEAFRLAIAASEPVQEKKPGQMRRVD